MRGGQGRMQAESKAGPGALAVIRVPSLRPDWSIQTKKEQGFGKCQRNLI